MFNRFFFVTKTFYEKMSYGNFLETHHNRQPRFSRKYAHTLNFAFQSRQKGNVNVSV